MVLPPNIKILEGKNVTLYNCTTCKKTFKSRDHCRYHQYCLSTGLKPFSCSTCDKKFSKKSHLTYHELSHTGELPFKCDLCEKGFRTNQKLQRHKASHLGKKLVSCYICDKQLSNQDGLRVHLRTHSESRPFKCDLCDATFKERNGLTKHKATHSDVKNWVCEVCGKKFTIRWNLLQHKRTAHASSSVSRPFSCEICHQDFLTRFHLKRHMKRRLAHAEYLEEYSCKICDKVFTRKDNLSRHVKNSHFEDEDPRSETVNNCIRESKQKVVRKIKKISAVMLENTNRSSVIKSVASVVGMAETSLNNCEKVDPCPPSASQEKTAYDTKEILKPGNSQVKDGSTCRESFRTVSVISRISRSSDDAEVYRISPYSNERLESDENFSGGLVRKSSQGDCPKSQGSDVCEGDEACLHEEPKTAHKLESFRILDQPSSALNLSAKKATYCFKKCMYDARKSVENFLEVCKKREREQSTRVLRTPPDSEKSRFSGSHLECVDLNNHAVKERECNDFVDPRVIATAEALQSYGTVVELVDDDMRIKPYYSTSSSSYIEQDTSLNYSKIEELQYAYYTPCPQAPSPGKKYAVSNFCGSFSNGSTVLVKEQESNVITTQTNPVPVISSKELDVSYSNEINPCTCRDCSRPESPTLADDPYIPSTSDSLDLSVRRHMLS